MTVFHLGRTKFARQLNGEGARLHGGRWNLIGQPCIYASETRSLCVLEYAANVSLEEMPDDLSFTSYDIPEENWISFKAADLPAGWMETPSTTAIKDWGTRQIREHLAVRVPSVVLPSEFNVLLNPFHPDFEKVRILDVTAFTFDRRIKK